VTFDGNPVAIDLVEPVRAYRFFRPCPPNEQGLWGSDRPGRLWSTNHTHPWPTAAEGGAEALCLCAEHPTFAVTDLLSQVVYRVRRALAGSDYPHATPGPARHPLGVLRSWGYGCGFYGLDPADGVDTTARWNGWFVGEVLLGGRVRTHRRGYRAQFATVAGIYAWHADHIPPTAGRKFLDAACDLYDVPLLQLPPEVTP